jgi:hypothetical protein
VLTADFEKAKEREDKAKEQVKLQAGFETNELKKLIS